MYTQISPLVDAIERHCLISDSTDEEADYCVELALISPSNVSPTMLSNGKYRSGAKADTVFILYILNCLSYFVVLLSIIS